MSAEGWLVISAVVNLILVMLLVLAVGLLVDNAGPAKRHG